MALLQPNQPQDFGKQTGPQIWPQPGTNPSQPNNFDPRIGNGQLPQGISGAAERAYVGTVQPDQLSQNQLNGMLNKNNEYMRSATQAGLDQANQRGLLNSTMAAGASRRAAIDAAAPFALADAKAYQDTAHQNVDVLNARANTQDQANAQVTSANTAAGAQMYGDELALQRSREGNAFTGEQNELQRQYQNYIQDRSFGQALGLQNNQYSNQLNNGMRQGAFDAAVNSGMSSQNYYQQASIAAMNNPAIISNPQNFQNYLSFMQGPYMQNIDDYLSFALQGWGG